MINNKFGEIVYNESDLCNLILCGQALIDLPGLTVDSTIDVNQLAQLLEDPGQLFYWKPHVIDALAVADYDYANQQNWLMPDNYKEVDIAEYVLGLCTNDEELQRVADELLKYQERDLFNLLRYLKYLVDVMHEHNLIWGVGRGSSVASYVLYKIGIHKIDSLFYDLDVGEFLR